MSQTHVGDDQGPTTGTPRWVMVFVIIGIALVLLVAILMFAGVGGEHGPGRHSAPIEYRVQQP